MHDTAGAVHPGGARYAAAGPLHHHPRTAFVRARHAEGHPLIGRDRPGIPPPFRLLLALLGCAAPLAAQERAPGGPGGVRAFAEVGAAATRIHGEGTAVFALGAGLSLGSGLSVGGAARLLPAPVEIGRVVLQDVELEMGYGGLLVELRRPAWSARTGWLARTLIGAGNADVLDRATSLRLDSDNFLVLEPAVGLELRVHDRVRTGASLSYRFVFGVEDLRGVAASDLRSVGFVVHLRVSPL